MSIEPINTVPIQQFIKQVQSAETGRAKEVRLTIDQAKQLSYTLGIAMARLNGDLEKFVAAQAEKMQAEQVIDIKLDQGSW